MRIIMLARVVVIAAALLLAACTTFSPDGGMNVAANIAEQELHKETIAIRSQDDADAAGARVRQFLKRPLTADTAVQVALLNNRGLQAAYNDLGIAEAVSVRQSLPPNPSVSISRVTGSVETEIDRQIVGNILALVTLPVRSEIAADRFRQAQLFAALETLRVAAETRRAFYRAVGARELVGMLAQADSAAATSAQLAKRLGETGAMNKLDQAREQAFHAEVTTQLARARQRAVIERERLIRSLGLSGNDLDFGLSNALPALPRRAHVLRAVEQDAVSRRVDLQIARIELETLAKSYGLTQATRFINVLDAGYADKITNNKETGEHIRDRGFTVTFEVPLFDFGETRVREAEQTYMQAVNRLAEKAVNVRSEARLAYSSYRSSYDIANRYQRDVLPLRKTISDEMILRYGAMQVDVFSLLNDARQRIAANIAAAEARRDFWIASVDLSAATIGGGAAGGAGTQSPTITAAGNSNAH
jgi:outer membrane protein TolC